MRRLTRPGLPILLAGLLGGCTGTGVFLDHVFKPFGENPNNPAGNSETFRRTRGLDVDVEPLVPERGNVWPGPQQPDLNIDDLRREQNEAIRRNGGAPPPQASGQGNNATARANAADRGLPPPQNPPPPPQGSPTVQTPSGPAVDTGGGSGRSYRQLTSPSPRGNGILVPNGNGTSTLIGPDGSVQTVPTRP